MDDGLLHSWALRKIARSVSVTSIGWRPFTNPNCCGIGYLAQQRPIPVQGLLQRQSVRHTVKSSRGFRGLGMP